MAKTDIRTELLEATGLKAKKADERGDLEVRIATYISEKMSEEDYGNLSKDAQKWYEKVVAAMEKEKPVPDLPVVEAADDADEEEAPKSKKGAAAKKTAKGKKVKDEDESEDGDGDEDDGEDSEDAADEEEEKPKGKKGAAAKKTAAKKAGKGKAEKEEPKKKAKKAEKEDKERTPSGSDFIRVTVCKNPKLSFEQVQAKLEAEGLELAEVQARGVYAKTKRVVDIMLELGWTKG